MSFDINWLAVIAAAVSAFVLGGIWYGPLFKNAWCREAGIDMHAKPGHPGRVFGSAFVLALALLWWRDHAAVMSWRPRRSSVA